MRDASIMFAYCDERNARKKIKLGTREGRGEDYGIGIETLAERRISGDHVSLERSQAIFDPPRSFRSIALVISIYYI